MLRLAALLCCVGPSIALGGEPTPGQQAKPPGAIAPLATPVSPVPLELAPIGARALGMGQAFIGVVDDPVAAVVNPAGLTQIREREVSLHLRHASGDREVHDLNAEQALAASNAFLAAAGWPALSGSTVVALDDSVTRPSFLGVVYPLQRWTVAAHYEQSRNLEGRTLRTLDDAFHSDVYESRRDLSAALWSLGVSAGYEISPRLSVGVLLAHSTLSLESRDSLRIDWFEDFEFRDPLPVPPEEIVDFRLDEFVISDEDSSLRLGVGVLYEPLEGIFVGLRFQEGETFELQGAHRSVRCIDFPGEGACIPESELFTSVALDVFRRNVEVPDLLGLGASWRPRSWFTLAADVERSNYSNRAPGGDELLAGAAASREPVDDSTAFRLGAEFTLFAGQSGLPLSIRAGMFSDPDHDETRRIDSDELHWTLGLGLQPWTRVGLDLALHLSDPVTELVVAATYRF
ncbi:MAG: hypothetical protein GY716_08725 [bacterium]|nr:hypothetical protein [bacterium]